MRLTAATLFGILALACAACGKKPSGDAPPGNPAPEAPPPAGAAGKAFLDATKEVPARLEWGRDMMSIEDTAVILRVTTPAPAAVTLVTDDVYQARQKGNKKGFDKSDVLFAADAGPPSSEHRVTFPPGRLWVVIENRSDAPARVRLECFEGK